MRMEEINRVLKSEFYLNNNEMLIFNFLAEHLGKKFTAEGVAEKLDLPMGKIYDLLTSLEEKCFIQVDYKKPKVYYITDLKTRFEAAFDKREKTLMELERKIVTELKTNDKSGLEIHVITSDDELYLLRKKLLLEIKEYRKSSFDPSGFIEMETSRRKYKELVMSNVIENRIDFKWLMIEERLKESMPPRLINILKEALEHDNIDIRFAKAIPTFDIMGDVVLVRVAHVPGCGYIYIKSKKFADECKKIYDDMFKNAVSIKQLIL